MNALPLLLLALAPADTLIPLATLLAPPAILMPRLHPAGTQVAYVAPLDGVQNLFVASVAAPAQGRPVTRYTDRGVQPSDVSGNATYHWMAGGKYLVFLRDTNGDENHHLIRVEVATGTVTDLTPEGKFQVRIIQVSPRRPNQVLIGINDRVPALHDPYVVDVETGKRTLVERNDRFYGYVADDDFRLRLAIGVSAEGAIILHKSVGDGTWATWRSLPPGESPGKAIGFDRTGRVLYATDSHERNTAAVIGFDLTTGAEQLVAADTLVDIGDVLLDPLTGRVQAYSTNYERVAWHPLDPMLQADFAALRRVRDGDLHVDDRSADGRKWLVRFTLSDAPETYYLYDRSTRRAAKLFVSTPALAGLPMARTHVTRMTTSDGVELISYLTLPRGADPKGDGRPAKPVPMVVLAHGGPTDERAQYGFFPFLQWLANRGYAVLNVNFRGSPGFGKKFLEAERHEWGGRMNLDVVEQVAWAVQQGIAPRDKVAIMGGSYGGYETLAALAFTPDVFACGVDVVGPSDLETFMANIPPYWSFEHVAYRLGDPRTPEGVALLRERSPIRRVDQIRARLLIGQGANDVRVKQAQSDSMARRLDERGVKVTYALYPDEGHGFLRPENDLSFFGIAEVFLKECLGGRARPLTTELLKGSSIQVPVGARHIPGLEDVLNAVTKRP